jgi:hypothetical protein
VFGYSGSILIHEWMDGWILFRPEALSLKGLGTLTTYNTYDSFRFSQGLAQAL